MSLKAELQEILVLEPDKVRAADVAQAVSKVFPSAKVYCETSPMGAVGIMTRRPIDLFMVAVRGFDLDILTLLGAWADHGSKNTRVLVMTPDVRSSAVAALRSLPINGYFNSSSGDLAELEFACRAVASGGRYCSPGDIAAKRHLNPEAPDIAELLWRLGPPRPVRFSRRIRPRDD